MWVISLFIALTEVVLGIAASRTTGTVQIALTTFVIFFPCLVATAFFVILWYRPYVLYPPSEYCGGADVGSFVNAMDRRQALMLQAETVRQALDAAGLDLQSLATGQMLNNLSEEIKDNVERLVRELRAAMSQSQAAPESQPVDPDIVLLLARGLAAEEQWFEAAARLDEYVGARPDDWNVHFFRAVAHANCRGGATTDLAALRSYNEAIALCPPTEDRDMRARLFAYRGAMLKRLMRLDEAEQDLRLAGALATAEYERSDVKYNLACVFALRVDRRKMMEMVKELREDRRALSAIRAHLGDYFRDFNQDAEFLRAISAASNDPALPA